jgi:hypothetical protein
LIEILSKKNGIMNVMTRFFKMASSPLSILLPQAFAIGEKKVLVPLETEISNANI